MSEESVCQKQIYQIKEVTLTCSLKNHVEASLSKLSKVEVNKLLLDYQSKFDETLIRRITDLSDLGQDFSDMKQNYSKLESELRSYSFNLVRSYSFFRK